MGEFGDDQPDIPQIAARHHGPHMPHQTVTGIAIVHGTDGARRPGNTYNLFAFLHGHCHGLFAEHVEAGGQKRFGNFEMRGVWSRYGNKIQPVLTTDLGCEHFTPIAIGPVGRNAEALGIIAPCCGVVIQRSSDEIKRTVKPGRDPMGRANLAALAATNQAPIQYRHGRSLN